MFNTSPTAKVLFVALFVLLIIGLAPTAVSADGASFWKLGYLKSGIMPNCDPVGGCTLCDLLQVVQNIIYFGLSLVVFVLFPVFITIGGVMITISGGSTQRLEQGKATVQAAVIGLIISLAAFALVNAFLTILGISLFGAGSVGWSGFTCTI